MPTSSQPPFQLFKSPNHVAIIMDGNSRWAHRHGYNTAFGHAQGAKKAKEIVEISAKNSIKNLSLYAFTLENWSRPKEEVNYLLDTLMQYLIDETKAMIDMNIKFHFVGSKSRLNSNLIDLLETTQEQTKNSTGMNLYLLFDYSGQEDLLGAVNKLLSLSSRRNSNVLNETNRNDDDANNYDIDLNNKKYSINFNNIKNLRTHVSIEDLKQNMYCPSMPDVDLLIRTGNTKRLSNILPMHISYSEICFLEIFWPEFQDSDFRSCLEFYERQNRTFGGRVLSQDYKIL